MSFFRNLMFLTSLAFVSWIILCYFDPTIDRREPRQQLDFENSLTDVLLCDSKAFQGFYGYINFMCIFTGIYILARFIEIFESFFASNLCSAIGWLRREGERSKNFLKEKFNIGVSNSNTISDLVLAMHAAPLTLDNYRKITFSLREEITKMWERNKYLDQLVCELEQHNLLLVGKDLLIARKANMDFINNNVNAGSIGNGNDVGELTVGSTPHNLLDIDPQFYVFEERIEDIGMSLSCSKNISYFCTNRIQDNAEGADGADGDNGQVVRVPKRYPFQQNIFVANRYFHINCPLMNVNKGNGKLGFQISNIGEFTQIWQKYLRMCSLYREKVESNVINVGENVIERGPILKKIDLSKLEVDFSSEIPTIDQQNGTVKMVNPNQEFCNPTPIVVTTADLEKLHGTYKY